MVNGPDRPDAPPPGADDHLAYARAVRQWYATHAVRARLGHQVLEIVIVVLGASVPVAAAYRAGAGTIGVLGALVVVATGVRTVYGWHESWIGFVDAQVQLDDELALYALGDVPYDAADRGMRLARAVQRIQREETDRWRSRRLALKQPAADGGH